MLKSKRKIIYFSSFFILAELFLSVMVHKIGGRANDFISVATVLLCCIFCVLFFKKSKDYLLVQAALFFTVMADVCLLIIQPRNQLLAMLFFLATQTCYFLRILKTEEKLRKIHLFLRTFVTLAALVLTVVVLGEKTDLLSLVSLFYFANLGINVLWAFVDFKSSRFFAIGLLLFLLCDICIGLSVMNTAYIPVSEESFIYHIIHPGFNLAWCFYIPSQVLIVLSLAEKRLKKTLP